MKVVELVFGLGVITVTLLSGEAGVSLWIRAYSSNGLLPSFNSILQSPFLLGTRVLLICHVTGLAEGTEVTRYRWFRNCTGDNGRCQVHDGDPYYRVVKDTLLVDVISWNQGGKYNCFVDFSNTRQSHSHLSKIAVTGSPAPFLYTPTTLLPEHSVLTDVQQATGRNGQQWITCRSGGEETRPEIWMGSEEVAFSNRTANSAKIVLGTQRPNGLYHCLSGQSQREYFSLFLRNSVSLPTPTVSSRDTSMWTLTSPDGSQVERYIVEFGCRVRNITFVEKYMSVSASGGTGQVATSVSCFGGIAKGQLYRVKVWAVSGPSISRALVCIPNGQCREEGSSETVEGERGKPNEPQDANSGDESSIGLAIGLSLLFLLALYTLVVIIVVVAVVVKRKAACKQKRDVTRRDEAYCSTGDEDGPGTQDLNPHMVVDRDVYISIRRPAPNVSSSLASTSNIPAGYETLDVGYTINNEQRWV